MALTALATANTTIGPSQYADMAQALAPRFLVDTPTALQPSYNNGTLTLQPGACLIAGTRVRATSEETVAVPPASSGMKYYAIILRVDWSKGANDAAQLICLPSLYINKTTSPQRENINRIPGVLYDALIATVTRKAGYNQADVIDYRVWGGDGGPLRVSDRAMNTPQWFDARVGTFISTDKNVYTKRLDNDGVWRAVGSDSNPWRAWTPTLRYYEKEIPDGTSGGKVVGLGNGGWSTARYRIVDGLLDGMLFISPGPSGATFGAGPITFDLPVKCAAWQTDVWSQGHLYTFGYGGDGNYDWHAEAMVKAGWSRAQLFTNPSELNARLQPYMSQSPNGGGPGSGTPYIKGGYPVGYITCHVSYPVDV